MQLNQAIVEHLKRFPPFQNMQEHVLDALAGRLTINYFAKGETIIPANAPPPETFYIVKQGIVQTEQLASSARQYRDTFELHEGECFPLGAILAGRSPGSQFVAATDTFVYELSLAGFAQLRAESPVFRDYCEQRTALLLEYSKQIIQAQYSRSSAEHPALTMPLQQLIRREPVTCSSSLPLRDVLQHMKEQQVGSIIAVDDNKQAVGIFTLQDLLTRVALPQADLDAPFASYMTADPVSLPPDAPASEAALIMARRGFRHIVVADVDTGRLRGMVSEKDLFSLQRISLRQINLRLQAAQSVQDVAACCDDIRKLGDNMMAQGIAVEQITQIISALNDLTLSQISRLMRARHPQVQTLDYCWLALGSEGRMEQTLYTDQDNGIVFSATDAQQARARRPILLAFAKEVNQALDTCGFPLCKGNIMASNPQWCLSAEEWRARFGAWVSSPDPQAIMHSTIFFDFRALDGNEQLATSLRQWLNQTLTQHPLFLRFLTQTALSRKPPLGLFRDFVTSQDNTLDLKTQAAVLFVDAARILALQTGSNHTNTVRRLKEAGPKAGLRQEQADAYAEAFLYIQLLRMQLLHQAAAKNQPYTNQIDPGTLNALDNRILREAFRLAKSLQSMLAVKYAL
ncbi:MAG: DUF294 nucleotidyltransferase-like domain-containing protein [Advenella sp.]